MVILEEGNIPHPWCPLCDMLVPWKALNEMHRRTAQCNRGAGRRRWRLAAEEGREVTARAFSPYGRPLEMVTSFLYLRWVTLVTDYDCPAVVRNLSQVRAVWKRVTIILIREGAES